MPPGNIPEGLADFASDEESGMQIDSVTVSKGDKVVKLLERLRVVIAGTRLKPGPEEIQSDGVNTKLLHFCEVGFNFPRIPRQRPLESGLGRNPMGPDWNEPFASMRKAGHPGGRGSRLIDSGLCPAVAARPAELPGSMPLERLESRSGESVMNRQ
jgi:hypothetical protein